jgi:hypothetical protein
VGKIELQRLPVVAVIEGDVDGGLRASEEQPAALWILADDVNWGIVGQAACDSLPGLAAIARAIDIRGQAV